MNDMSFLMSKQYDPTGMPHRKCLSKCLQLCRDSSSSILLSVEPHIPILIHFLHRKRHISIICGSVISEKALLRSLVLKEL